MLTYTMRSLTAIALFVGVAFGFTAFNLLTGLAYAWLFGFTHAPLN